MSAGLVALLDDVAAIAKVAAASLDDIGPAAMKASSKAVGVVIDDTAVTPRYVQGFAPERELPIIGRIALGSLRNKIVFILPVALLLSQFLPAAMTPLLMLGGVYLCFEGAEKVYELLMLRAGAGHHAPSNPQANSAGATTALSDKEYEEKMVTGAVRTDLILSAEIMAIALAEVSDQPFLARLLIMVMVALVITALVYGVVGLIVKMDDIGLRLATRRTGPLAALGRALVKGMPKLLAALSGIGTAAMLWVGGHILLDGLSKLGFDAPLHLLQEAEHAAAHALPAVASLVTWLTETLGSALVGLLIGGSVVGAAHLKKRSAAA